MITMEAAAVFVMGFMTMIPEARSEWCSDEKSFCHAPAKCCEEMRGCCYDNNVLHHKHFGMQVWNMWYFWFLIIFMMLSCFGGCGYYRRRRLAMLSRNLGSSPLSLGSSHRQSRRGPGRPSMCDSNYFFPYGNGAGVFPMYPQQAQLMPPAYSEVMSHPGLYPNNKDVTLPPYPGADKPDNEERAPRSAMGGASANASANARPADTISLPPPYSEFPEAQSSASQPEAHSQQQDVHQCEQVEHAVCSSPTASSRLLSAQPPWQQEHIESNNNTDVTTSASSRIAVVNNVGDANCNTKRMSESPVGHASAGEACTS